MCACNAAAGVLADANAADPVGGAASSGVLAGGSADTADTGGETAVARCPVEPPVNPAAAAGSPAATELAGAAVPASELPVDSA